MTKYCRYHIIYYIYNIYYTVYYCGAGQRTHPDPSCPMYGSGQICPNAGRASFANPTDQAQ